MFADSVVLDLSVSREAVVHPASLKFVIACVEFCGLFF